MLAGFCIRPGPDPVISYRPSPQASAKQLFQRISKENSLWPAHQLGLVCFTELFFICWGQLANFSSICWDNTSQRPNRLPFSSPSCRPFSNPSCRPFLIPPAGPFSKPFCSPSSHPFHRGPILWLSLKGMASNSWSSVTSGTSWPFQTRPKNQPGDPVYKGSAGTMPVLALWSNQPAGAPPAKSPRACDSAQSAMMALTRLPPGRILAIILLLVNEQKTQGRW